uniref:Uncharacterized protein n=1 Tax=Lepeophtheirus salmonis TaxID=72036 RepID=A0A0K2VCK0_LEPSM
MFKGDFKESNKEHMEIEHLDVILFASKVV